MTQDNTIRSAVEAVTRSDSRANHRLSLDDLHDHSKIGIRGPNAVDWLQSQTGQVPSGIYEVARDDAGSLIVRVGDDEIIVESPGTGQLIDRIEAALAENSPGVYRVEQQSTSLRLGGAGAPALWRQTCGVDIPAEPVNRILYTRVAGVSCGIIPEDLNGERAYRLWVDYSYAPALLESLLEITESLDEPHFLP